MTAPAPGAGYTSQDFDAANDRYDNQLADDFRVPAGETWTIAGVDVVGYFSADGSPPAAFNVYFYENEPASTFAPQQQFDVGASPFATAAADFNGDGQPDVATADAADGTVSLLLNTTVPGAPAASFADRQAFAVGAVPYSVIAVDVDGDGKPDLVAANVNDDSVSVLINTTPAGAATASFAAHRDFAVGAAPFSVVAADVNGDGRPDLVVANRDSDTLSVLLNDTVTGSTTANFAAQQVFAAGATLNAVTAADLNGDGAPDLIVANRDGNTASVLVDTTVAGSRTVSFAPRQAFGTGASPYSVVAADVNGDGTPDVVVANWDDATASVLLNTTATGAPTASFAAQQVFAIGAQPFTIISDDVDEDGIPDLLVANSGGPGTASVLINTTVPGSATARFAPLLSFQAGYGTHGISAIDVNGDGARDLVVANNFDADVSVLLNTTSPWTGQPGAPIGAELGQPYSGGAASGDTTVITLAAPVALTAGAYWMSVQAREDLANGQWFWADGTAQTANPPVWQNPADGSHAGCLSWTLKPSCGFPPDTYPAQLFRLRGDRSGASAPTIAVVPASLSFTVPTGTATASQLSVQNVGGGSLTYQIAETACAGSSDIAWLDETPASGTLASGVAATSRIAVDAADLAPGSYSANLCVTSNDAANPRVTVPVRLTVTGGGGATAVVTSSVGVPAGAIDPSGAQTVNVGTTATFTLTPASGYHIDDVGGTCGGTLSGNVYTTAPVTADCTVIANFASGSNGVVRSGPFDHAVVDSADGTSLNVVTGAFDDTGPASGDWDLIFWDNAGFAFWGVNTYTDRFAIDAGGNVAVLHAGDTVGPASTFSAGQYAGSAAGWLAGTDAYAGYKFNCDGRLTYPVTGGVCYGYVHITTTGPTGYPATIRDLGFDGDGDAITIPDGGGGGGGEPTISVAPTALSFALTAGTSGTDALTIGNVGGGLLTYAIAETAEASTPPSSYLTSRYAHASKHGRDTARTSDTVEANPRAGSRASGAPIALGDTSISEMADNTPGNQGVTCGQTGVSTADNSWWRRYYFDEFPQVGATATIRSVTISSGSNGPSGFPVTINLYTTPHGVAVDTIDTAQLTSIGSGTGTIDSGLLTATIPVTGTVDDTAAEDLVVEWHTDGFASGQFFPGANATAETHPTFLSSEACGMPTPTPVAQIGFPNFHLVEVVTLGAGGPPPTGCRNPADVPWLRVTPSSGSLAGGTTAVSEVTADASSLSPGTYSAGLCVTSNDAANPQVTVPISLIVAPDTSDPCRAADTIFCDGFDGSGDARAQPVVDSSFEAASANAGSEAGWQSEDTASNGDGGTVLYSASRVGIAARTGDRAAWFGGWGRGAETQLVSQTVALPQQGPLYLNYWRFTAAAPDVPAALVVTLDGTALQTTDLSTTTDAGYVPQSIDVGRYADGKSHRIELSYAYDGSGTTDGSTFVDDVTIDRTPLSSADAAARIP
ncbi:MAG TPA: VCBS repeat-containing protein [Dokdonella sp.]